MPREQILFVTGRLAERALRRELATFSDEAGFDCQVAVLGISVAALMHVDWVRRKLQVPSGMNRVILPGWCQGDLQVLQAAYQCTVERGPKDLHDLPVHFGRARGPLPDLSRSEIEIVAEINHAPRLSDQELLRQADAYRRDGADVIDLGCIPGESWSNVGSAVARLKAEGFRISIDSFDRQEVEQAVASGAELVLSCNQSNVEWAAALPAELVVVPDDPHTLAGLAETVEQLTARQARFRLDPVLEPIGFGFAESMGRYLDVRRKWPAAAIMMGVGNLTELTEVDSAGINLLLAGFCQETAIHSVLTTQVINWCRTAVREFDLARRMVAYAVTQRVLPKHLGTGLSLLRDPRVNEPDAEELEELARQIKDPNFRVFVSQDEIHVLNRDGHWHGTDPYVLLEQLGPLEASHAFYLGYELSKAMTALTLGKSYRQDEALQWGWLTRPEISARHRKTESP